MPAALNTVLLLAALLAAPAGPLAAYMSANKWLRRNTPEPVTGGPARAARTRARQQQAATAAGAKKRRQNR